jgi:hypothetical protein
LTKDEEGKVEEGSVKEEVYGNLNKRGWLIEIRRSLIRMRESEEGRGR